jgi:hypothetical protein
MRMLVNRRSVSQPVSYLLTPTAAGGNGAKQNGAIPFAPPANSVAPPAAQAAPSTSNGSQANQGVPSNPPVNGKAAQTAAGIPFVPPTNGRKQTATASRTNAKQMAREAYAPDAGRY